MGVGVSVEYVRPSSSSRPHSTPSHLLRVQKRLARACPGGGEAAEEAVHAAGRPEVHVGEEEVGGAHLFVCLLMIGGWGMGISE